MRAVRLHEIGGVPQLDEIDPPRGSGLARVVAGALNPIDITIGSGRFYGGTPRPAVRDRLRGRRRRATAGGSGCAAATA